LGGHNSQSKVFLVCLFVHPFIYIKRLLTVNGKSEDEAGSTLVLECRSESLRRDERFYEVSHHVNLRLLLLVLLVVLLRLHAVVGGPAATGVRGGGGGGTSPAKVLSFAPDDRVVEQVEAIGDELAFEVRRLSRIECPRLRLGQHVNC